jgi:hypothetical protein
MNRLVVLTDLGTFKAYRLEEDRVSSIPRLQPVDSYETPLGDDRIGRRLSDQSGQFQKGGRPSSAITEGGADGERHNIWLENDRRSVKKIADRMNELLSDGQFESCYFAASNEINREIVNNLSPQAKAKIEKNLTCNLVNAPKEELLNHFK